MQEMLRDGARGRLPESCLGKLLEFGQLPFNDRSEQGFLAAESEIEARRRNPDRLRQIAKRRPLIAIPPKEGGCLLERIVNFKLPGTAHITNAHDL
ncbi:hypothetical protein ACVWYO_003483 [Sphingomonas sp. UYP23]